MNQIENLPYSAKTIRNFWNKVIKLSEQECWEWTAVKTCHGYGRFWFDNKLQIATRFSYLIHHGPIPADQFVLHTCDNPGCVNPGHLFLGTMYDNVHDMFEKNRQSDFRATRNQREPARTFSATSARKRTDKIIDVSATDYSQFKSHFSINPLEDHSNEDKPLHLGKDYLEWPESEDFYNQRVKNSRG